MYWSLHRIYDGTAFSVRRASCVFGLSLLVCIRLLLQLQQLPGYWLYLTGKHKSLLLISFAMTHMLLPLTRPSAARPPVLGTSHIPVTPFLFCPETADLAPGVVFLVLSPCFRSLCLSSPASLLSLLRYRLSHTTKWIFSLPPCLIRILLQIVSIILPRQWLTLQCSSV